MNNNQLPMYQGSDQSYSFNPNMQGMNSNLMFERLNRRINRLERQMRIPSLTLCNFFISFS